MTTDLAQKIIKQIEYYFGDVNLSKDKFLKDQIGKENGWIAISTLLTFNRLKALTEEASVIADAFLNGNSELVELNEANDKLRRLKPMPEVDDEFKQNYKLRAVHLKGFPKENTTLDELIEYCSQYGDVESVQMRRLEDKTFKGCCFAVYKEIESANKAIAGVDDKFKGEHDIKQRENKDTYIKRKAAWRNKKNDNKAVNLKVNDEDDKNGEADDKNENQEEEKEKPIEEKKEIVYQTGCVMKLIDLPENITFKDIKPKLAELASVRYVDIFPETHSALVRFSSTGDRDIVLKTLAHPENGSNGVEKSVDDVKIENVTTPDQTTAETKAEADNPVEMKEDQPVETKSEEEKSAVTKEETSNEPSKENTTEEQVKSEELKSLKIGDLILRYSFLEGDEEKVYYEKLSKLTSNPNKAKYNHNKKKRFGGYSGNRFNKNKRPANGDHRNNAKKAKVDN